MKFILSIGTLLFAFNALAGLGEDFRDLKDSAVNYEVVGAVCEEVTRLRFQEEFPVTRYGVVTGVEYGDGNRTIGELDVVVYERANQHVVRIAEVKCWRDTQGAIAKARNQRQRFMRTIKSGGTVQFRSLHSDVKFRKENFTNTNDFIAVAQKGSKASGFDRELSYELKELMQLRSMMIDCQHKGQCAAPNH